MKYYPAFLDVRGRRCVVVGGGRVAERKAIALLDAGAHLTLIGPTLTAHLAGLHGAGTVAHRPGHFQEQDLDGAYLVIAATDDAAVNESVARACRERGILVNAASSPDAGTFVVPSVAERGDLLIAVSTCGDSPALARRIREDLERTYGPEYGIFLEKMADLRTRLLREVRDEEVRRRIFQAVVDADVLALLKAGRVHEADQRIAEIVKAAG